MDKGGETSLLKFRKFSTKAYDLKKEEGDAGYDLHSVEIISIPARGFKAINTDIGVELPKNTYGRVAPRSGLALNFGIDIGAGVIDSTFRGPIRVVIFNHGEKDFLVNIGDRVAQLVVQKIEPTSPVEVEELTQTSRGTLGFGSTGK